MTCDLHTVSLRYLCSGRVRTTNMLFFSPEYAYQLVYVIETNDPHIPKTNAQV